MYILLNKFKKKGKNIILNPFDYYSFNTITIGSDVYIGPGAYFSSAHSSINIGNKVMFGPGVKLLGGNHVTDQIGRFMFDIEHKTPESDAPIVIEDDVWIGANVVILKGVTVKEGSIVGANSLVNKDVPPYSIVVGSPAKVIRFRFSDAEIVKHKDFFDCKK